MKTIPYYQQYITTLTPEQRVVWNEALRAAEVVLNHATEATWDHPPIVKVEKDIRAGILRLRTDMYGLQLSMQPEAILRSQEDPEA